MFEISDEPDIINGRIFTMNFIKIEIKIGDFVKAALEKAAVEEANQLAINTGIVLVTGEQNVRNR